MEIVIAIFEWHHKYYIEFDLVVLIGMLIFMIYKLLKFIK